jgi:cell division transport system permease protein
MARKSDGALQERRMPRLPGGFSLPPFGLHQWLALVIVCIALWAIGLLWLVQQAGTSWTRGWQQDIRFHIYLDHADTTRLQALADKLRAVPGVARVRIVPIEETRTWLDTWLGGSGDVSQELLSALPGSIEVTPDAQAGQFLYDDLADTARASGADINRGEAHLVQARRMMARVVQILWFGTLIIALAMIIVISNTLRMILLARADEVQLMRLLGANEWFVRMPFLLEGGLLGAGAGLLAWLLLWPPLIAVGSWLQQLHAEANGFVLLLPLLLGGALVGWLGALLATTRMASENTATT